MHPEAETIYSYFLAALRQKASEEGYGVQNSWAVETGKTPGTISQIINGKARAGFDIQIILSRACGYDYIDFLRYGRQCAEGDTEEEKSEQDSLSKIINRLKKLNLSQLKEVETIFKQPMEKILALAKLATLSPQPLELLIQFLDSLAEKQDN